MHSVLINRDRVEQFPPYLGEILPFRLTDEIRASGISFIEEIRLRRGRCASLTVGGRDLMLGTLLTSDEIDLVMERICGGSLYAFRETIKDGYIIQPGGVRVGICGRAAVENRRIIGVNEISALVFRIPHKTPPYVGEEIVGCLRELNFCGGVLIYSPPGVGKTSVLRGTISKLASGSDAKRVAVIDTRGELAYTLDSARLTADILTGYPKRDGISIAARTLGAQVIVCDEIGDSDEADSIAAAHNSGVPLVASAHASSLGELMKKPGIAVLHRCGCFGAYVGLSRRAGVFEYAYDIATSEVADGYI